MTLQFYEMSYQFNFEMHKQTEIAKRLNNICARITQILPPEVAQCLEYIQWVEVRLRLCFSTRRLSYRQWNRPKTSQWPTCIK